MTFDDDSTVDVRFEGRRFPSESEWLDLQLPGDAAPSDALPISADFVARTLQALRDPRPEQLEAFAAPEPSSDFVARTVGAIHVDRRQRWRELLSRYVAPEPSREFVARTLKALDRDPGAAAPRRASSPAPLLRTLRTWGMPLLAAAAVVAVMFFLPGERRAVLEARVAGSVPVAFATAYAGSPLPALLSILDEQADPLALPNSGGDGVWLLQHWLLQHRSIR